MVLAYKRKGELVIVLLFLLLLSLVWVWFGVRLKEIEQKRKDNYGLEKTATR